MELVDTVKEFRVKTGSHDTVFKEAKGYNCGSKNKAFFMRFHKDAVKDFWPCGVEYNPEDEQAEDMAITDYVNDLFYTKFDVLIPDEEYYELARDEDDGEEYKEYFAFSKKWLNEHLEQEGNYFYLTE